MGWKRSQYALGILLDAHDVDFDDLVQEYDVVVRFEVVKGGSS
jgi:hypothetical protein